MKVPLLLSPLLMERPSTESARTLIDIAQIDAKEIELAVILAAG